MKMWLKMISLALVVVIAVSAVLLLTQGQKDCCLCDSFRYHAPCLIDLETGALIELNLYFPHHTKVAELADPQPEMGTISFVRCGNVSGYKNTHQRQVKLEVPTADRTFDPALCRACRNHLQTGYWGRYVLADLYDIEIKTLIPITDGSSITLRCYNITMVKNEDEDEFVVVIEGTLLLSQAAKT